MANPLLTNALDLAEDGLEGALHNGLDLLGGDEGHLNIALGELRLTVCTQVLVAETFYNLEVTVHARYHQQLL